MTKHIAALLIGLTMAACSRDQASAVKEQPFDQSKALQPLAVGNSWTYRGTHFTVEGVADRQDSFTLALNGDTLIDGYRWFTTPEGGRLSNQPDGLLRMSVHPVRGSSTILLKYPAVVGDRYTNGASGEYVVASTSDSVEVPAGRYTTHRYTAFPVGGDSADYYYAPHVGLVKSEYFLFDPEKQTRSLTYRVELVRADLK